MRLIHFKSAFRKSLVLRILECSHRRPINGTLEFILGLCSVFFELRKFTFIGEENVHFIDHEHNETDEERGDDYADNAVCGDVSWRATCGSDSNICIARFI